MAITSNNLQPTVIKSWYTYPIANQYDPYQLIKDEIVTPMLKPIVASAPVRIDRDGVPMTADDVTNLLMNCCDDNINIDSERDMKAMFKQTLVQYSTKLAVQDVYSTQSALMGGIPESMFPSDKVIYVPGDVVDVSKKFLSGQVSRHNFFATVAFYTRISTFGYYFANEDAWNEFKAWFATEISQITNLLSPDTIQLCMDLQNIRLDNLTESFAIRNDSSENNEPYSFARILQFYLMMYEDSLIKSKSPAYIAGHMPFSVSELFCPTTVVIMNVEKHAHAHPSAIKKEWDFIKTAIATRPRVLTTKSISRLTAATRMAAKMKNAGATTKMKSMQKSAKLTFRNTPPDSIDIYKYITKIYKYTTFVQCSENATKSKHPTYQKASRREPDNPDRQGVTNKTTYKPDLHIYLDCSGSINEANYKSAIMSCIKLAKKLNINFYFTSFSHYMSESTKLPIQGKSESEIYRIFTRIPKVGGGTNYEQIWHYINRSKTKSQEVSIIISDFEYTAPSHFVKHPRFLYYVPVSSDNWPWLVESAKSFAESMMSICPSIRKHILM